MSGIGGDYSLSRKMKEDLGSTGNFTVEKSFKIVVIALIATCVLSGIAIVTFVLHNQKSDKEDREEKTKQEPKDSLAPRKAG